MDEVITCKCGNQAWVIGSYVRCSKCGYSPIGGIKLSQDVSAINAAIAADDSGKVADSKQQINGVAKPK